MLEFAFGSKRAEPSPQAAVRPRMLLPPMAEGHMLVDRAAERIQAYRRLRRIRAIREERRPARLRAHALAKTTAPAGGESRLFEPFRSPEPMLAPGPAARPPWHERFWARTRHMAAASGRILMAAGALGSVAYMTVLYYIEYIPEVRHLHIEAYPFLRDFKPEYIRFLISYGLPTAVGAFALSKSDLKFIDRIKAAKDL
ncbi:MAG: hypothetical protein KGH63_02285, partial [Candidatus Micrarchaeota archaeon]|nr:hypothetical protein [Candidatus Micrarchaeota archaeon]